MKRFDKGNEKATKQFEEDVNKELAAFKADRYSGWFGWARKIGDWWKGMDDLPAVKAIFDRNRAIFVTTIDALVAAISADNKRVVQECKDELQNARTTIKEYVDSLAPGLKDIGNKTAEEMNSKLDEMDKFVAKREEELQNQLKDKQTAAIKAIDEKIEKMKEAMAGALAKLGKLLLWAAKKFFTWALEKFGFSLSEIEGIINKGVAVLKAIFTKPIQFVKNLIGAAKLGFNNFGEHFLDHLKDAVFEWLTGSLDGVKLPQTWDLKGIAGLIFELVGISYQNFKKFLVKYIPEPVINGFETTFTLIQTLRRDGMMAAWEQLKGMAEEMKNAFVTAVSDWIKWTIVKEAIKTAVAAFTPGAGIIRAIIGIYDTVVFFIQKAKDIMKMIGNFLGSISEIAAGNIGAAAEALEDGLARGLVLVIEFLARLLRLKGITTAIKKVLDKIRGKVDGVLDRSCEVGRRQSEETLGRRQGNRRESSGLVESAKGFQDWQGVARAICVGRTKVGQADGQEHTANAGKRDRHVEDRWPTQRTKEKRGRKIEAEAKNIDKLKAETGGSFGQEAGEKIMQSMTIIAANLAAAGLAAVPKSKVKFNTRNALGDKVGSSMVANPLSVDPGGLAGSQPHQESKLWKAVNQREGVYIRGHLLNHHVFGPGSNDNLVPITRSANTTMESQGEHIIKKAVLADNLVISYTVTAKGKQPARKFVPAESELPAQLILHAVTLEEDSGKWTKEGTVLLSNFPIDNTLGPDVAVGLVRPEVNLSSGSRADIATIPGIGPVLADRIVKAAQQTQARLSRLRRSFRSRRHWRRHGDTAARRQQGQTLLSVPASDARWLWSGTNRVAIGLVTDVGNCFTHTDPGIGAWSRSGDQPVAGAASACPTKDCRQTSSFGSIPTSWTNGSRSARAICGAADVHDDFLSSAAGRQRDPAAR